MGGIGQRAKLAIDAGLQLFDEETAVAIAVAAAEAGVTAGRVFSHAAQAGVIDADEDQGLDQAFPRETVGGRVGAPRAAWYVGGAAVEEILAIVEIEDGKSAGGLVRVGFRQVDFDVAIVGQE